jgi:hypothetical protein
VINVNQSGVSMRETVLFLIGNGYKFQDILKLVRHKKSEVISYGFINEKYLFEDNSFVMTIFDKVY